MFLFFPRSVHNRYHGKVEMIKALLKHGSDPQSRSCYAQAAVAGAKQDAPRLPIMHHSFVFFFGPRRYIYT